MPKTQALPVIHDHAVGYIRRCSDLGLAIWGHFVTTLPWNWFLDVHTVCEICWTGGATLSRCVFEAPGLPFIDPHLSLPLRPERMTFDVLGNHESVQKQRSFRLCGHEGIGLDRHVSMVYV